MKYVLNNFSRRDAFVNVVSVVSVECRNRLVVRKKGNLKESGGSIGHKRRVSFDPLALLLDASLEGELELVMRTAEQVSAVQSVFASKFGDYDVIYIYSRVRFPGKRFGGGTRTFSVTF